MALTRSVVAGVLLGIAISLLFFQALNLMSKPKPALTVTIPEEVHPQPKEEKIDEDEQVVEGLPSVKSGDFGQNDIYSYVPYDSSFYFESSDSSTLGSYFSFMGGDFFTIYESIKDSLQSSYGAFHLTKGPKSGWVIITFSLDDVEIIRDFDSIHIEQLLDNVLVISQVPV